MMAPCDAQQQAECLENKKQPQPAGKEVLLSIVEEHQGLQFRRLYAFAAVLILLGAWLLFDHTYLEHKRRRQTANSIREKIEVLVLKTPVEVPDDEWSMAVLCTSNLHSNSLLPFQCELSELKSLENEIAEKTSGRVSMQTIDWIWDRYAELCPAGHKYRQGFHGFMLEQIKDVREYGDVHRDAEIFRRDIERKYRPPT